MLNLSADEIIERLLPHLEAAGLTVLRSRVSPFSVAPLDTVPLAGFYVSHDAASHHAMFMGVREARRAMSTALGRGINVALYDRPGGHGDVSPGEVLLEFDSLPFTLEPDAAPAPFAM